MKRLRSVDSMGSIRPTTKPRLEATSPLTDLFNLGHDVRVPMVFGDRTFKTMFMRTYLNARDHVRLSWCSKTLYETWMTEKTTTTTPTEWTPFMALKRAHLVVNVVTGLRQQGLSFARYRDAMCVYLLDEPGDVHHLGLLVLKNHHLLALMGNHLHRLQSYIDLGIDYPNFDTRLDRAAFRTLLRHVTLEQLQLGLAHGTGTFARNKYGKLLVDAVAVGRLDMMRTLTAAALSNVHELRTLYYKDLKRLGHALVDYKAMAGEAATKALMLELQSMSGLLFDWVTVARKAAKGLDPVVMQQAMGLVTDASFVPISVLYKRRQELDFRILTPDMDALMQVIEVCINETVNRHQSNWFSYTALLLSLVAADSGVLQAAQVQRLHNRIAAQYPELVASSQCDIGTFFGHVTACFKAISHEKLPSLSLVMGLVAAPNRKTTEATSLLSAFLQHFLKWNCTEKAFKHTLRVDRYFPGKAAKTLCALWDMMKLLPDSMTTASILREAYPTANETKPLKAIVSHMLKKTKSKSEKQQLAQHLMDAYRGTNVALNFQ